ncbi:MAG: tripartite tricarboxylate transporter substrate binding protein [Chromatiales bacterium]|nr:tripartite tricarboxylate transporter substrate binding protein [Chromatiales bacterium]
MKRFVNPGTLALAAAMTLTATFAMTLAGTARAEYPEKPVQFIVPWPPGDLEDVLTRMIAEELQSETGVAAAVVNKPGGGGGPFPGAAEVARAPADGYTVGSFVIGVPTVGALLGIEGIARDTFEPIGIFLTYPFVLAAAGDAPYSDMAGLAAHAKDNKVALGHFGYGLVPTRVSIIAGMELGFEFGSEAAFDMLDCNSLASGDADVINTTVQLVLPCLEDIKPLASITGGRIPVLPDTPTMAEQVPGLDISLWNGLFVPKGTPQAVKDKLAAVAERVVMSDKAQKLSQETGALVYWQNAEQAAARIDADYAAIEEMFKRMGDL